MLHEKFGGNEADRATPLPLVGGIDCFAAGFIGNGEEKSFCYLNILE
jgi:hypothetical protein